MSSWFTIAYEDEHLLVVDKGPGLVVHPARGHREGTLAQLLARCAAGGDTRAGGDRAPARPRHLGPARGRTLGGGPPAAAGGARAAAHRARVPGARARAARRRARARSRRRSGATRACARAWPSAAPARARRAPTSRSSARCRRDLAPAAAAGDGAHPPDPRPPAGDRPSGVRRPRVRHAPGVLGLERQFLHATRLAFDHPLHGRAASRFTRRCRRTSRRRWRSRRGELTS